MAKKKSKRKSGSGSGDGRSRGVQSRTTWWFLRIAPVVIAVCAIAVYFGFKSAQGAAIVTVFGAVIWLAVGLGNLGSSVPPRDASRGGAIEFGKPTRRS